jgi:endonuclease-3
LTTVILEAQRARAKHILEILRNSLSIREEDFATLVVARESSDPFRVLVVTILSQNCTDIAALRAYRTLEREVGVTPLKLSRSKISQITKAIHAAGLHRQKARALKRLAQIIADRYSGTMSDILHKSVDEARTLLQQLPKVGPKTADVLLSVWGQPTISVDTHVDRVSKRLGLAPQKANYEETRTALMQLYRTEDYRLVPLLFMAHGRNICKAVRPRCPSCPVERLCRYTKKTLES